MTSPIEGTQDDNGPVESDYEPMRPDDPEQGEEREPIALGGKQEPAQVHDPETKALLEEASDLAVAYLAIPEHERLGYTPVPQGGTITEQFMVHDEDPDPRRAKNAPVTPDPHELKYLGVQDHVRSMVALNSDDGARRWAAGYANRRVYPVQSITVGQPLMGVIIPERHMLVTEEEAREMGRDD